MTIVAPLRNRTFLRLSGRDVLRFLQGQTTNSLSALFSHPPSPYAFYTSILIPQGRILQDLFLYPTQHPDKHGEIQPAVLMECDVGYVSHLQVLLRMYKVRADVVVKEVSREEVSAYAVWDRELGSCLGPRKEGGDPNALPIVPEGLPPHTIADPRAPGFAFRGAWGIDELRSTLERYPLWHHDAVFGEDKYRLRRYLWGIPEGINELALKEALPLESNLDLMRGVDFKKGCYTGQELTIRTKHRGVVRKRILPVVLFEGEDEDVGAFGEKIMERAENEGVQKEEWEDIPAQTKINPLELDFGREDGRTSTFKAGKILGSIGNVGLGLIRLEFLVGEKPWEKPWAPVSTVDHMGRQLKVKAHVPWWHKVRREAEEAEARKNMQPFASSTEESYSEEGFAEEVAEVDAAREQDRRQPVLEIQTETREAVERESTEQGQAEHVPVVEATPSETV